MKKLVEIKQDRRTFLKNTSAGLAGLSILSNCTSKVSTWRFFTGEEANVVIAMCEQIIPADEDGGATQANVINFIDRQLVSYLADQQETYRKGIRALQEYCRIEYQSGFEELPWDDQTAVLEKMESGEASGEAWGEMNPVQFFNTVRAHTMMGFYGPPRHGGNKDLVSYRMLDYDYPQVIGRHTRS